ncbi:MAG TPA: hypothetical protein VMH35_15390 [Streptosporangiaceae bacterium]|nr:hypothetical protein [Streptosporangiaceae bacterium]
MSENRPVSPGDHRGALVRLVTRLIVAQAAAAAAIGLCFSKRHLPSILFTVVIVAVLCGLAVAARTGSHAAWVATLAAESALVLFGVLRFMTARYVGGTLFAIITAAVLIHPAVARAYGSAPQPSGEPLAEEPLGETGPS